MLPEINLKGVKMKTLDIDECADFLKISRTGASEMAVAGDLPGARIGSAWVFLEEDLVDYLRTLIRVQRRDRQAALLGTRQDKGSEPGDGVSVGVPSVLQSRRGRQDFPTDRSRDFTAEKFPAAAAAGG
ncbi:MAG: helix-turn-helix domain-containing protein [Thiobacillus sp.]|nr:helix-turn-helix domain-containing protein [Thiobacillus sp.]